MVYIYTSDSKIMYLKGIKREDVKGIIRWLNYGKDRYIEYATKTCGCYRKQEIIEYDRIIKILKECLENE